MRLNLACSRDIKEGYINLDIRRYQDAKIDIFADALQLPFKDEIFDEIYCSHFMEHLTYVQLHPALLEWKRVLKLEGVLRICVPDFAFIAMQWMTSDLEHKLRYWNWAVCGSQAYPDDVHKCILDKEVLFALLGHAGFVKASACHGEGEAIFHLWIDAWKVA